MSWSFTGVGTAAALAAAIDQDVEKYTGQSREEFAQVAPHLKGLLAAAHDEAAVALSASGHASFSDGKRTYAVVSVEIKQLGAIYREMPALAPSSAEGDPGAELASDIEPAEA